MRPRFAALGLFFAFSLGAQVPDPAFFQDDPHKAMLFCAERARALDPHKELVLARAGRAHLAAGDLAGARALFQMTGLGLADTQLRIGQAWLEAGDLPRAVEAFSLITARDPYAKNELTEAAVLMMDNGHPQEAGSLMKRAYELAPGDWQNADAFARACLRQRHPDLAAEWFANAAAKNRKEEEFWMDVAHSMANHGAEE